VANGPFVAVDVVLNKWDRVIQQFPVRTSQIIGKWTFDTYARSQITVPVRRPDVVKKTGITGGFLKQSGSPSHKAGSQEGEVRYTAYYAGYVHEGTFKMPARPFLRDASDKVMQGVAAAFAHLEKSLI
jgi:HK97 gp10 family phage protein